MNLQSYIEKLKVIIWEIEDNNTIISEHNRNAQIGNIGSAAAYLLTSNSDSKSTRTIGQVGAVAGLMYSASERNKSNSYRTISANSLLRSIPEIFNTQSLSTYTSCKNSSLKQEFLSCVLTYTSYLDDFVLEQAKSLQSKHLMSRRNLNKALNLTSIDFFSGKYQILLFLSKIDNSIHVNFFDNLKNQVRQINIPELKKEFNYHRGLILTSALLLITGVSISSQLLLGLSVLLMFGTYVSSAFRSFFPEHRKLHLARQQFFKHLKVYTKISTIKYY